MVSATRFNGLPLWKGEIEKGWPKFCSDYNLAQIVLEKDMDMGKFKILSVLDGNGAVKETLLIGSKAWDGPMGW